jgi:hypothetical protein
MGWIIGAVLSGAFLFFGGPQVKTLLLERGPTPLSCQEFLERGARADWIALNDCHLDWDHAREFQATRYRKALYVPATPSGRPAQHQLFIRLDPKDADRGRTAWRGMLNTPSTDAVPDFARGRSVHILYPARPSTVEMLLAVIPALLFVGAAIRARRHAAGRAADLKHLRARFPPLPDPGDVEAVDVGPVIRASAVVFIAVAVALVASGPAIAAAAVAEPAATTVAWSLTACLPAAAIALIAYRHRVSLDDRLLIVARAALVALVAIIVPLCIVVRSFGPLAAAVPLLLSAGIAWRARQKLLADSHPDLMKLLRAMPRDSRKLTRHRSASRRPVRVLLYRAGGILAIAFGLLSIVGTGTNALLLVGGAIAVLLWNRAARHATFDARAVMERDPRPPVLLLRSFGDDDLEAKGSKPLWSYTQTLAFVAGKRLQAVGPVIAVAPPHEGLPPLGPYRVFVQKEDWQTEVDHLITSARSVALFIGVSAGVLWEFRRLIDGHRAIDLMLVVPPVEPASLEKRWEALIEATRHHPAWSAVRGLDPQSTLLVKRLPDDRLMVFRGHQTYAAYDWAFQLCAAMRHVPGGTIMTHLDGSQPASR